MVIVVRSKHIQAMHLSIVKCRKYFLVFQEDINQFWKLQEGRQPVVVENAHNIIAAAAVHFTEVVLLWGFVVDFYRHFYRGNFH